MQVTVISDTHGLHESVTLPGGDLLIHCGDVSPKGDLADIERFLSWFSRQDYSDKVFIAGNHDWLFQRDPRRARNLVLSFPAVSYLQDSAMEVGGLKLYGSPWSPQFYDWAFMLPRRGPELAKVWAQIPSDTDVLITHTPPYDVLDLDATGQRGGCEALARRVDALERLRLHAFGHQHRSHGRTNGFVNASVCDNDYEPINPPVTLTLREDGE